MEVGDEVVEDLGKTTASESSRILGCFSGRAAAQERVSDLTLRTALNQERSTRSWIYQRNRKSIKAQSSVIFWKHLSGVKFQFVFVFYVFFFFGRMSCAYDRNSRKMLMPMMMSNTACRKIPAGGPVR